LAVIVIALALGLVLALFWPAPSRKPEKTEWPTVARSNLLMRAGCWFSQQGTNVFTGRMVDFYPDGTLRSRTAISNGLLNGLCESWFTNGQIQSRECFSNSVSSGPRSKWHENGQLQSTATIVDGVMEGVFRRWHDNGQLAEVIPMEHGEPNGSAIAYYASGFVKAETQTSAGKIFERKTWADGEHRGSSQPLGAGF
jgi:antitoxin component YwqK of YwqJK toxin-antitoxin module